MRLTFFCILVGPLKLYGGPVLYRNTELLGPYALGCFAAGLPVTLEGLGRGNYMLQEEHELEQIT